MRRSVVPEADWVGHFCPLAPASKLGLNQHGGEIHVYAEPSSTVGGMGVLPNFLTVSETLHMTALVEQRLGFQAGTTEPPSYFSNSSYLSINPLQTKAPTHHADIAARLRTFPGITPGSPTMRPHNELIQMAVTGRLGNRSLSVHHDRNQGQFRVLTILGYLGRRWPEGAHTIFPLVPTQRRPRAR